MEQLVPAARRKDIEFGPKADKEKKRGNEDIVCPEVRAERKLLLFPASAPDYDLHSLPNSPQRV